MLIRSLFLIIILAIVVQNQELNYKVTYVEVPLDHFNFVNNATFKLRYLIDDSKSNTFSPIFFYTGNEGDIELFAQNSGFLWKLANQFKATVVFAEHRYYGKSLPFGKDSFKSLTTYGYLSAEQALADYSYLVELIKGDRNVPVIAFGGSYGGMLATWFRMKYPHLVYGALAASAPIWQFNNLTPCDIFAKILTSVFNSSYSSNCTINIKRSWDVIKNYSSTDAGKLQLQNVFTFCNPITKPDQLSQFLDYLEDVYANLAMANYPYKSDFFGPLPAYPVRQFCFYLKDQQEDLDLLIALRNAVNVYTNSTGSSKCLNYTSSYNSGIDGFAWEIQTCNEMVMPMCSSKETMFRIKEWNFTEFSENCFKKFNTRPKENEMLSRYGGKNLDSLTNIIFSNGLLDPWSGGGVLHTNNNKITIIIIPEGAHHIDLRSENQNDPKSVTEARKQESDIISQWLSDYKNSN